MKTWGPADPNIFFWKWSSDIILWWFAFILSILRCCADIRFTLLLFSFWWPMFKSCWNSISFYYWFCASKQSSIKMSAAKSSWIHRLGKVRSSVFHGTRPKPGISGIIGLLIKINSVFASIGVTSTTQQCSIIKNINHKILYWLFKTDQKLRGHVVKSCYQDLRSCYVISGF